MKKSRRAPLVKTVKSAVATVHQCKNDEGDFEADARLIAAAPELLAMCEEFAESLHVAGYDFTRATGRRLLAVIAKAKGAL
jgi:hypothetical protein